MSYCTLHCLALANRCPCRKQGSYSLELTFLSWVPQENNNVFESWWCALKPRRNEHRIHERELRVLDTSLLVVCDDPRVRRKAFAVSNSSATTMEPASYDLKI